MRPATAVIMSAKTLLDEALRTKPINDAKVGAVRRLAMKRPAAAEVESDVVTPDHLCESVCSFFNFCKQFEE